MSEEPRLAETPTGDYTEITISVSREAHELVCDFIIQKYAAGLILEDEDDSSTVGIRFYVDPSVAETAVRETLALARQHGIVTDPPSQRCVRRVDWEEEYRKSVEPIVIDSAVVVRPTWCQPITIPGRDLVNIVIDPKMAFGSGKHETTQLCLSALLREDLVEARVADIGCGSLILSLLASKRGAAFVKAVDNDPIAVENSMENRALNLADGTIEVALGSIERFAHDAPFDIVVANIIRETIVGMFPELARLTRNGGRLILSGLLVEDGPAIEACLIAGGFAQVHKTAMGEWLCYCATRRRSGN